MSKTAISPKNLFLLWGMAGGRCQYRGCNTCMYEDGLTKSQFNQAYVAHIVADSVGGPRGHAIRSALLANDIKNLMLLCDVHHRLIDKFKVNEHPESLLLEMKKEHEDRIKRITDVPLSLKSHVVTYKANIGEHSPVVTYESVSNYLLPKRYPAESYSIDLGLTNSPLRDRNSSFWTTEIEVLELHFKERLLPLINSQAIKHISLFAFAPMPLLIKLGTLLNDIQHVEIHQPIRNPKGWNLLEDGDDIFYQIVEPDKINQTVAINISLSADIHNNRITSVLGDNVSIYTLKIENCTNDFLQNKKQLQEFANKIKYLLNKIKLLYGADKPLHIFPAMPIATAIELGRSWMPKADMSLIIYDENKMNSGFAKAIEIN